MTQENQDLIAFAKQGNIEKVEELIKAGTDVNIGDKDDITALHEATTWLPHLKDKDFLGLAKLLIEAGADINKQDRWGATSLYLAAVEGFVDVVKYMHSKGGKVDIPFKNGHTHLHEIAIKMKAGFSNLSLTITENGVEKVITDIDEIRKIQGKTIQDEFLSYVSTSKFLIESGADINAEITESSQTPLFLAADHNSIELARLLIDKGVKEINYQDKFGYTALHYASKKGNLEIVKLLVVAGANPKIQEKYGFTPLHEAAENDNVEVLEYLLERGGDITLGLITAFDRYAVGDTPLQIAEKANRKAATEFLKGYSAR